MTRGRWPDGKGALQVTVNGRTYLTTAGAARMLGRSPNFVLRFARRGVGPDGVGLVPVRAGNAKRFLFTPEAVGRFAEGEKCLEDEE